MCFAEYGADATNTDNNLPMPAPLDLNNGEYRRNADYEDSVNPFTSAFAGRLPYDVSNATSAIAGMGSTPNIFSNSFCNNLDLPSTAAVEDVHFSDDSGSDSGEYFDLWQNWKDHFFYAVSEHFKPDGPGSTTVCGGDCVKVNGTEYAAIVFFSGLEQAGQHRYAPPFDAAFANDGVNDKDDVDFYLENNNDADFPDNTGDAVYEPVNGATSNDVMFCIKQDMSVVECS